MSITRFWSAFIGIGLILSIGASTAEAAKGVKKAASGNGQRTLVGTVVSVSPDKTGYGVFKLKTGTHHKKMIPFANAPANAKVNQQNKPVTHELNVTSATRFEHHNGNSVSIVTPAALKKGERVRVRATGPQAQTVQILTNHRYAGRMIRYRANNYRPHLYHHPVYRAVHAPAYHPVHVSASHPVHHHPVHARRK